MTSLLQKFKALFVQSNTDPLENATVDDEEPTSVFEIDSKLEQSFAKQYPLPKMPITAELISTLKRMHYESHSLRNEDDYSGMCNAMYVIAEKRMSVRPYDSDDKAYLLGLLSDINEGKREFSQVCYENDYASDVFKRLQLVLLQAYSEIETD